jgi:aminoglycoside phosphotransferase (APT) family kinase protein
VEPVGPEAARAFLDERFAPIAVSAVEPLGGGAWSRAYGFALATGEELVARFGEWREDFEADLRAMALAGPDLPVPRVLEVGDAPTLGASFALSERHRGTFLEQLDRAGWARVLPAVLRLLDALRRIPRDVAEAAVGPRTSPWDKWLRAALVDEPGGRVSGWRARLAADPHFDALFREGEAELDRLGPACPDLHHVLHLDLLHGNVLVAGDASRIEAVFDWGCHALGDPLYELAWFSFWAPFHPAGLAHADVVGVARAHLAGQDDPDLDLSGFDERLRTYEIHIGLTHLAYHAFTGEADDLAAVARRLRAVLDGA